MPTFHRRNGSVKYVPPKRLLEGLRPAVAIPATLFAGLVVIAILFAMHKAPREQKWVNLRPEAAWRPALTEQGEAPPADERFLFTSALERARTPRATRRNTTNASDQAPAAGRVVLAGQGRMVVEHAIGKGPARQFVRTEVAGISYARFGTEMNIQRGDLLADGQALNRDTAPELASLPVSQHEAAPIREASEDDPTITFGR